MTNLNRGLKDTQIEACIQGCKDARHAEAKKLLSVAGLTPQPGNINDFAAKGVVAGPERCEQKQLHANSQPALNRQVGGGHYKHFTIQPVEYITKNNIPYLEGNVIKYVSRWKEKGGFEDLDKAIHYIQLIKELHESH